MSFSPLLGYRHNGADSARKFDFLKFEIAIRHMTQCQTNQKAGTVGKRTLYWWTKVKASSYFIGYYGSSHQRLPWAS